MTRPGRDAAERLVAGAVRLLPAERHAWGRAMRAELAGLPSGGARWRFALGCLRVVATRPAVLRGLGYRVLGIGVLVATIAWSARISFAPLRWGLVASVSVLVAVSWLGRHPGLFGPVGAGRPARFLRAGAYLMVGAMAVATAVSMAGSDNPAEKTRSGVPMLTVVLTGYLLGFLAVTARRSAATGRVLTTATGIGVAAVALWTAVVLATPPVPAYSGGAMFVIASAMAIAALANNGPYGSRERATLAALCTGTVATLLTFAVVELLASYGPAILIPDLAPAALTPADDFAQSRNELVDPYVAVLFLGCLVAFALSIAAVTTRQARSNREPESSPA